MVVQKKIRELIHPELIVVNVDGTPENVMPEDAYVEKVSEELPKEKEGMIENLKHIVGL
jgi:5,10-methenyltetrahydromethanopterin hydrogenase